MAHGPCVCHLGTRTCPMQTAVYDHPTYSLLIVHPGHLDYFSKFSNNHFKRYIHFLHTPTTYPKKTGGITALSSLIIPICQNHHLKFTNYLMNICHAVKNGEAYYKYIKQQRIKSKELKNQSIHVCLKLLDATILELGHYVSSNYKKRVLPWELWEDSVEEELLSV